MRTSIVAALLLLSASPAAVAGSIPRYRVQFFGNATRGAALNELGTVAGSISVGGVSLAAVSVGGGPLVALPLPAGYTCSAAFDLNDAGVVVGTVSPTTVPTLQPHAAAWYPGPSGYTVQVLGEPSGLQYSAATGVNDLGDIIGSAGTTPWFYWVTGVHFAPSGPVALVGLDSATDVNDHRKVLSRNWLYDLTTQQIDVIPLPPGNWQGFGPAVINEIDGFGGYLQGFSSTCASFPMRYLPTVGWTTVGGCAQTTSVTALNDLGDVLHYVNPTAARVRLEGIGDFTIGELIDPSQGLWYPMYYGAADINNARQILVVLKNGAQTETGAALLTQIEFPSLCAGDGASAVCPCGNAGATGHGCENSASTGGALLVASGVTSPDTIVFSASGELPSALTIFLQGNALLSPAVAFGDGVRCVGGNLKRLYVTNASFGVASAPSFGEVAVGARSAALGDPIAPGTTRWYQAYYRDPDLAFCPAPAGDAWNATNAIEIGW